MPRAFIVERRITLLVGTINGKTIYANTFTGIKRKASIVANGYFNTVDELEVRDGNLVGKWRRFNKKYPNNTIHRGTWR